MKRSEWRCARCHESTSVDEATCVHCDWPREEAEQSSRRRLNPLWSCSKCGREEQDECTECTRCSTPRWNGCEQFDGTRFFVNRTPMDRELDCSSMPLLHWLQLLRPPSLSESLSALFVSGMVDDRFVNMDFVGVLFFFQSPSKIERRPKSLLCNFSRQRLMLGWLLRTAATTPSWKKRRTKLWLHQKPNGERSFSSRKRDSCTLRLYCFASLRFIIVCRSCTCFDLPKRCG
jgi:hypothetical protein